MTYRTENKYFGLCARYYLEPGEFSQFPMFILRRSSFKPAGLADAYIIMQCGKDLFYVPIVDAKDYAPAVLACLPAIEYQKSLQLIP